MDYRDNQLDDISATSKPVEDGTTTADDSFDVDIQPDVSALRMFRSMSFTPWYALGEFVDNSITSAMKNRDALITHNGADYKVRIQIEFPDGTNDLVIRDNAAGISQREMDRALRTGSAPQDIEIGLSRHGVGMKAAAFWWGSRLEIKTYPLGEPHGWHTVVDVPEAGEMATSVKVKPIPSRGFPGTEIWIRNLWQKTPVRRTKGAIRAYLPSIYRAFLGGGTGAAEIDCTLEYDGTQLKFENPPLLEAPYWPSKEGPVGDSDSIYWRKAFDTTLSTGKRVSGWYGILETLSRDKSGFFLHYRGKGIAGVVPVLQPEDGASSHESAGAKDAIARATYKPRRVFGAGGSYPDQSFIGEFDVSDFGKTISTDAPLWSPDEESEFVDALYADMTGDETRPFIKMANNYRRNVARETRRDIEAVNQKEANRIRTALDDSLEHVEVNDLPTKPYSPPPAPPAPDEQTSEPVDTDAQSFTINDRDGHSHSFRIEFIADRSADFIGLYETGGSDLEHTVHINRSHPALDDIPEDARTHLLLRRLAVSLASAEVFLTMRHKEQVREKMNEHLLLIGRQVADD